MKKLIFTLAALMLPLVASASGKSFTYVDGIYYDLYSGGKTAAIACKSFHFRLDTDPDAYRTSDIDEYESAGYSGSFTIPSEVTYDGVTYKVTRIYTYAFADCTGLTSVTIPSSVTSINDDAFKGCTGLTSITLPGSVTTIGSYAFVGCTGLTSVTIPSSVTYIGSSPFSGCTGLTSIVVESGNTIFDSRDNCNAIIKTESNELISGFKNTTIPNSVTSIGSSAFSGCTGLASITLPVSVTSIGSSAFSGCTDLTSITLPGSVTTIGYNAFQGCNGLTSITLTSGVTTIGGSAFSGCTGLTSITLPSGVTKIESNTFEGCTGLTSVTIPNNVTSIGAYAFKGCSGLTSATIGSGVTTIGNAAFSGCSSLIDLYCTALKVPSAQTSYTYRGSVYYNNAFKDFETKNATLHVLSFILALYKSTAPWSDFGNIVAIPDDEVEIDEKFTNIISFADAKVKAALVQACDLNEDGEISEAEAENLTDASFNGCSFDKDITSFNELSYFTGIKKIGESLFKDCINLTSVTLPSGVTSIGNNAFSGCSSLSSLTIPSSVTSIGSEAFYDCSSLSSLTIPIGVTSIGNYAFNGCFNLNLTITRFTYYDNGLERNIYYGDMLHSIGAVTIADNVTSIPESSFRNLSGLKSVTIGSGVTTIGGSAFYECRGLISVTIGSGVTSIGSYAFDECNNVGDIYCLAEDAPQASSAFAAHSKNIYSATLHVPAAAVNIYKTQEPWSNFTNIVALDGGEIPEIQKCATPTISIVGGKIKFSCATEGVSFQSSIQVSDAKSYTTDEITLANKYKVTVFAKKKGCFDSDTVTAEFEGSLIKGDVNNDGQVNVADHVELSKIIMDE